MAMPDPTTAAAAWASRLSGSTEKIKAGIQAVTVAPGVAAARQKDVWLQNVTASAPKWATNTAAVSLQEWQTAAIEKGANRIGPGAQAAQAKMANFLGQLFPHIERVRSTLPARGNLDVNINRMVAFARGMSTFKKTG